MECSLKWGNVLIARNYPGRQELLVEICGKVAKAMSYPSLTGPCQAGDRILLNTTAEELQLGTGGWHYVLAVLGRERSLSKQGHIMKLRYTPLQGRVLSVEEEGSPYHQIMAKVDTVAGMPVATGSLHSMLAPLVWTLHQHKNLKRIVYLMSDGAALPLGFSKVATLLKAQGLIYKTITFGHAFGGDFEAVNIYSALLAAKHVAKADLAIVLMGPGVVGTKTKWGTTALEQGVFLNAASQLGGTALAIPRLSAKDPRPRHQGLSHHTQTVLRRVVQQPVYLPLPRSFQGHPASQNQLKELNHKITWEQTEEGFHKLFSAKLPFKTMGRGLRDDPLFFHGVVAAAECLLKIMGGG